MKSPFASQKIVASLLLVSLVFTQVVNAPVVFAQDGEAAAVAEAEKNNDPKIFYDLVTLVVDTELDEDDNSYQGLKAFHPEFAGKLDENKLGDRVLRYAEDLKENNKLTDVKILYFDKSKDTVTSLSEALENLYINGDSADRNRLAGVVLIGDIPLPVVNNNGKRFISVFPYTDFEDKTYIHNKKNNSYEKNGASSFAKPEVWHGIIRATGTDLNAKEKLAEFFDKNHLYYEGEPMYAKFDKKMFFADFVNEEKQINKDVYSHYVQYLDAMEDLSYLRFNKFWAAELTAKMNEGIELQDENYGDFADILKNGNPLANVPDIYTKPIIEQTLIPYYKVLNRYLAKVNDWSSYTARFAPKGGDLKVDSGPALIATKDEYTKYYLKSINDALEKKVNELVSEIEEPLPLIDFSQISGEIDDDDFKLKYSDPVDPLPLTLDKQFFRFHYFNEEDKKLYVNGIDANILNTAKQCSVYLGSTKSSYFDPQTLNFNPKADGGEYSILTRSLRSDDKSTAIPVQTAGINTRLLSTYSLGGQPSELSQKTLGSYAGNINADGVMETGAIIEDNPAYGISAFIHNPLQDKNADYKSPFEALLQKNDVIVKVNGRNLSSVYTFDQAIAAAYSNVKLVIDSVNDKKLDDLSDFSYPIKVIPGESLQQGNIGQAVAFLSVDFYRNGALQPTQYFSFSVNKDGLTTKDQPSGDPEIIVLLATPPDINFGDPALYEVGSQGAIFTLYENKQQGYSNRAYDNSAGCNARSTSKNSDRCFGLVASMPVLDPAGSLAPVKMQIPGVGLKLQFPANVKKTNKNENSANADDYNKNVDEYAFSDKYEDIDKVYYDACYRGLTSVRGTLDFADDSNPFTFVLDAATDGDSEGILDHDINLDFYGRLMDEIGEFIGGKQDGGDLSNDPDYVDGDSLADSSSFNPKQNIWLGLDQVDAGEIILSNDGGTIVTLRNFSDHYGLFDGVDNNGNGLTDYKWIDEDDDGVHETKFFDFGEADPKYGIPSGNLSEIARKMLSHNSVYEIPFGIESFPYKELDEDVALIVQPHSYGGKEISSMIIHNEPTEHTINEQLKSMTAFSLPIDNPRYVAFQSAPKPGPVYPEPKPKDNMINVAGILEKLHVEPHYSPGKIHKIEYVNIFETDNMAQLMASLKEKADELAAVPGSYRIFGDGAKEGDYSTADVSKEIFDKDFAPVVNGIIDNPVDGFNLKSGASKKLYDALLWKNLNIDEKHQYVLTNYLNGESETKANAFVGDKTLFPSQPGFEPAFGYEAAYLVLDGEGESFDMNFNKDLPEEKDGKFNPLAQYLGVAGEGEGDGDDDGAGEGSGDEADGAAGDAASGFEFVALKDFIKEIKKFTESLNSKPAFADACAFIAGLDDEKKVAAEGAGAINGLGISVNKDVVAAGKGESLTVTISGDASGASEKVILEINQNEDNPPFELSDLKEKPLVAGQATFVLSTTKNTGTAQVSAKSASGIVSENLALTATGSDLTLSTYIYSKVEPKVEPGEVDGEGGGSGGGSGSGSGSSGSGGSNSDSGDNGGSSAGDSGSGETSNGGNSDGGDSSGTVGGSKSSEVVTGDNGGQSGTSIYSEITGALSVGTGGAIDSKVKDVVKENIENSSGTDSSGDNSDVSDVSGDAGIDGGSGTDDVGDSAGSGSNDADGGNKSSVDDKDIEILESTPIEKIKIDSTLIDKEDQSGDEEKTISREKKVVDDDAKVITGDKTDGSEEQAQEWEEYFMLEKYYEKFLNGNLDSRAPSALFAELFSDTIEKLSDDTQYLTLNGDSIVADGESLMKIEATVFDSNGNLEASKNHKVKFSLSENLATFVDGNNVVDDQNGIATIYIKAGTKAGSLKLKAEVLNDDGKSVNKIYPVTEKDIYIVAGKPEIVEINPESKILIANGQSKTNVKIILKDKYGNAANNSFEQLAIFVSGIAEIDKNSDINNQILGTQVATLEGVASVDLLSKNETGTATLAVLILDYDLEELLLESGDDVGDIDFSKYTGATESFEIIDKAELELTLFDSDFAKTDSILADGKSIARLGVKLLDNGKVIKSYNGPITFKISQENLGKFITAPPAMMTDGELNAANVNFKSSTLTGEVEVLVNVPGFASNTIKFKTLAGVAKKIEMTASAKSIQTNAKNEVILNARVLDEHNNLVESDNALPIHFETTESTGGLINFAPATAVTLHGVASTTVTGNKISGLANIIAGRDGLEDGTISLKITKHLTGMEAKDFAPRALYVSLFGGAFAKNHDGENLAQTLLNHGQVQAISTLTAGGNDFEHLLSVDGYGKVEAMSENIVSNVVQANDSFPYQKIIFSDVIEDKELASVFVVPKVSTPLLLDDGKNDYQNFGDGIYVKYISAIENVITLDQKDDGIYLTKDGENKVKIDQFGRILISDDAYKLKLAEADDEVDSRSLVLLIAHNGENIVSVEFRQNFGQEVKKLDFDSQINNFFPGIYIQSSSSSKKYDLVLAPSGVSSNEPQGYYLVNTESETENADSEFGLGFEGSDKHMLLFSGGNSVGESTLPYASDDAIVYGDPMIKLNLDADVISQKSGYTKDLGKMIFNGQEQILEIIKFDYNADDYDDLLVTYEDGLVRLLENQVSNKRYRDRGYILNISNGILSATKIDENNDGYDDIIFGTKESCNTGEQCLSLFKNVNGGFEREPLELSLNDSKPYEMKVSDMNNDGCEDLVVSDSSSNLNIFYNKISGGTCSGLEKNYGYKKNFGFEINQDLNQSENLFINYPGMEKPDKKGLAHDGDSNGFKFIQFNLPSDEPPTNPTAVGYANASDALNAGLNSNQNIASKDIPPQTYPKDFDFIHIKEDPKFGLSSTKQSIDVNGGTIALGDEVQYIIALKNNSGSTINNLILSDTTPTSMTLLKDSLKCMDEGCDDELAWVSTGTSLRSDVIKGISVPANGNRVISYKMKIDLVPEVHFDIGNNFTAYPSNNNDNYLDIMVRPEVNPDGVLTYLYSTGPKSYEKLEVAVSASGSKKDALESTFEKAGLPSPTELLKTPPGETSPKLESQIGQLAAKGSQDKDYNGCSDSWAGGLMTSFKSGPEAIAANVESALSALRCSGGGCAPIPFNKAFLVPDDATPGLSLFAAGTANPPYFLFGAPSTIPSTFRIYLSPTLTLGLGTAICAGPSVGHLSPCFAFAIPGGIPGVCEGLQGTLDEALTASKNALVDPAVGQAAVIADGEEFSGSDSVNLGGNFGGEKDDPISVGGKANIKIPGFPSVITNWIDKQTDEIYNKLLDFPTFYLILPDLSGAFKQSKVASKNTTFRSFHDFATSVSSLPFVKIEGKSILVRVPSISTKEWEKYDEQRRKWLKHMEDERDKILKWECDKNEARKTICDKILVDMQNLISSVKKFMDTLDQIANIPKNILTWRTAEAKYATQIICYLDAIINYTGGYINRQQKIIESWMKAMQDAIKTFKDWKLILDVMAEYQQSCDQCKNDRFSKLGLLMQIFVAVPEPPVIPLPKWPDLVVDFSQIKTGVKIIWPDVTFQPEPIVLPNLPSITLPEILPDVEIDLNIPGFGFDNKLPDFSKFELPNLPDLPPLPLPQLPDIPRPPKIPTLPKPIGKLAINLKTIFKILCLIKNGLLIVPEGTLSTEIETLTQPSVQAVLPIIKNLGTQWPAIQYDYVKEIRVTGKLNFDIDTNVIYQIVEKGFKKWNDTARDFGKNVNKYTKVPYEQALNKALQDAVDKAEESALPLSFEGVPGLEAARENLANISTELSDIAEAMRAEQNYPDKYYVTATNDFIDSSHPILNKSLAEIERTVNLENFSNDFGDSEGLKQLANLRDSFIAYTNDLNNSNKLLGEINNYDDLNLFNKILVESDPKLRVASAVIGDGGDVTDQIEEPKLIASAVDADPKSVITDSEKPSAPAKGFYIVADGVNENILNYTAELNKNPNMIFSDADHDNDQDIVYSMGGQIYLKENHKQEPDLPKGKLILGFSGNSVGDYLVDGGTSVQNVVSGYVNNGKADLSWMKKSDETVAYQIIVRKTIDGDIDNPLFKYVALANPILSQESIDILDKLDIALPTEDEKNEFIIELSDKNNPSVTLEMANGNYYASVYAINVDGDFSIISDTAVLAPQSCPDKDGPLPAINQSKFDVSIFKDLEIDAGGSFDADGTIKEYFIEILPYENGDLTVTKLPKFLWSDLNVITDGDGDGIAWNDRNNPQFKIGPFVNEGDIGMHEVVLHVVDQSGNDSTQKITINVFAPDITLDETFARTAIASGETKPKVSKIPFSLMRNRYISRVIEGKLKLVPRIDEIIANLTDENGHYSLSNFNLENIIQVENANGEIVAEINPKTGNVGNLKDGYKVLINDAKAPVAPTSVQIIDKNGNVLGTVYLTANPNIDVKIYQNTSFTLENYASFNGVNVDDLSNGDQFEFVSIPADDSGNPGGALLKMKSENKVLATIDTAGNIIIMDDRLALVQKKNNHINEPLIIQMLFENKLIAEVLISLSQDHATIIGPDDVPFVNPKGSADGLIGDVKSIKPADIKSIIDNDLKLADSDMVQRKMFVKALLKMLCIVPGEEAKKPFESGSGYSDMDSFGDYHADIKEATLRNLIEGYKGESGEKTGLHPFKPEAIITRAEAVKIILEALEMEEILDLSSLDEGIPWYDPFMSASQNLTPYMKNGKLLQNNFIVTPEEAADPNKEMTYEELIVMVKRVIDVYNCRETDNDKDGMSDSCEEQYNIDDPNADPDKDELINVDECYYGLDPTDKDSDDGGVFDGPEISLKTNPLDPGDDSKDEDEDGLTSISETLVYHTDPYDNDTDNGGKNDGYEVKNCTNPLKKSDDENANTCKDGEAGIYIVPAECNTCPCVSTFLNKADIIAGDIFFSVIKNEKSFIFSKSNEVTIESVTKQE